MMTVLQSFQQITLYPIPDNVVLNYCEERGVDKGAEATMEVRQSVPYKLTLADLYKWLAFAPSTVSQGGVTFTISEEDKKRFIKLANKLYGQCDESSGVGKWGYVGNKF